MFEVHTMLAFGGGENTWMIFDEHNNAKPETFLTAAEAQKEIDEFLAEIEEEIVRGERAEDEGYSLENFCIFNISTQEYVSYQPLNKELFTCYR